MENTAIPLTGDERCRARGATPVCRDLAIDDLIARRAMSSVWGAKRMWWSAGIGAMHRLCNGSLLAGVPRPPVAAYW